MTAAETPRTDERATLTEADWDALTEASFRGGSAAWRAEIERILTDRLAAAVARAEAAEAKVAAVEALAAISLSSARRKMGMALLTVGDLEDALNGEPPRCPACGEPLSEDRACWSCDWGPEPEDFETTDAPVVRAHNHPPYRPACAERFVGTGDRFYTRGECLNDDGSDR